MSARSGWCLVVIAVVALGGACSDDPSAAEAWCDGVCSAVQRCGLDASSCRTSCVRDRPGLASQTVSGALAEKPCLAQLSCAAVGGDDTAWRTEVDACWTKAQKSVAVTDRVRRFCPDFALAWFECGYNLPRDDCEHDYSMWTDPVIDRLADCETVVDCDGLQTCTSNVFSSL